MHDDKGKQYFSQNGEDILLWAFFGDQFRGTYIDVGAFDGIHLSNTYSFEREGWRGVCVEPHPKYFQICKQNRPTSVCINAACVAPGASESVTFYSEEIGLLSSLVVDSNLDIEQRYARRGMAFNGYSSVQVSTTTLDAIVQQYFKYSSWIDILSVDVEGTEAEVLAGLTVPVKVIVVEAQSKDAEDVLSDLLFGKGYHFSRRLGENIFFTNTYEDAVILRNLRVTGRTQRTVHPLGEYATISKQVDKAVSIFPSLPSSALDRAQNDVATGSFRSSGVLFSCVVDKFEENVRQAWLLVCSLIKYGNVDPCDIVVHILPGVSSDFKNRLHSLDVQVRSILPFGDSKYCNKIGQLFSIASDDADCVILMDTDMLVVKDVRGLACTDFVQGKIVDHPNPPLVVLEHIFAEAGFLTLPLPVSTDIYLDQMTLSGNCNGGLYVIPGKFVPVLGFLWAKWSLWLLNKPDLLGETYLHHADQVGFCLAIFEANIPFRALGRKFNFPSHLALPKDESPAIFHYHRSVDNVVRNLAHSDASGECVGALQRANKLLHSCNQFNNSGDIAECERVGITSHSLLVGSDSVRNIIDANISCISRDISNRPKLFIHMGTQKTGTTAIQKYFADNHILLQSIGIDYLYDFMDKVGDPKHQRLFLAMSSGDYELVNHVLDYMTCAVNSKSRVFVMSTEGFYNYINEFGLRYMECVRTISKLFSVHLVLFIRPQWEFIESYYRQCIVNPLVADRPAYGSSLDVDEFVSLPWISSQLDYAENIRFLVEHMGEASFDLVRYSRVGVQSFFNLLGIPPDVAGLISCSESNLSLNRDAIEFLRIMNPSLLPDAKSELINLLRHVSSCSSILQDSHFVSSALRSKLMSQCSLGNRLIAQSFWDEDMLFSASTHDSD